MRIQCRCHRDTKEYLSYEEFKLHLCYCHYLRLVLTICMKTATSKIKLSANVSWAKTKVLTSLCLCVNVIKGAKLPSTS